jgi:outer membrane protein assembly factor BamB
MTGGHGARILVLLILSVNAIACAPRVIEGPEREASGWSVPLGASTRAPSADERVPAEPSLRWRANVRRGAAGPPALGDQVLAIATIDRALTLLQWETGRTVWRRNLGAPAIGAPIMLGDRAYVATSSRQGKVYAFTLKKGNKAWEAQVGPVVPPMAVSTGSLYVGTENGVVHALETGKGTRRWSRRLGGVLRCGPVDVGEALFAATDDSLFLLDPADGAILHRLAAPATVTSPPAWAGDTMVVASPDGIVAGLMRRDLTVLWTVSTGDPIFSMPSLARDTAFVITLGGALWRVPLSSPNDAESVPLGVTVRAAPSPTADGVLIGTTAGEILLASGRTAEPRARVDGPVEQPPLVRNGVLLVIDGKGRVMAWE